MDARSRFTNLERAGKLGHGGVVQGFQGGRHRSGGGNSSSGKETGGAVAGRKTGDGWQHERRGRGGQGAAGRQEKCPRHACGRHTALHGPVLCVGWGWGVGRFESGIVGIRRYFGLCPCAGLLVQHTAWHVQTVKQGLTQRVSKRSSAAFRSLSVAARRRGKKQSSKFPIVRSVSCP